MRPFFDKESTNRCRICGPRTCLHGWKQVLSPEFAGICTDHESLAAVARVVLTAWTSALQHGEARSETCRKHTFWLVECAESLSPPPATLEGLFSAALGLAKVDAVIHLLDAVEALSVRTWIKPVISKRIGDAVNTCVRSNNYDLAVTLVKTMLQRLACSDCERVDVLSRVLDATRFSDDEKLLDIIEAALAPYPEAPIAQWHGLTSSQLEEVRNWLEQPGMCPTNETLYEFMRVVEPSWLAHVPFNSPDQWSTAWYTGSSWKESLRGVISYVAEVSKKPSMVLQHLLHNKLWSCTNTQEQLSRRIGRPMRTTSALAYNSPYVALFHRIDELGVDQVCEAALLLNEALPHNLLPGFQELPKESVERIIAKFFTSTTGGHRMGPFMVAATCFHKGQPWAIMSSSPGKVVSKPYLSLSRDCFTGCVWLSSAGSITETNHAVKTALRKPVFIEQARKMVETINKLLPCPRLGWTNNLFGLDPSPSAAVALIERGFSMEQARCKWKTRPLTNEQKESNAVLGIFYMQASATLTSDGQLGSLIIQLIHYVCGIFAVEDLWVNKTNGSYEALCSHFFRTQEMQWFLNPDRMPVLSLVCFLVATFQSKQRGQLHNGLKLANKIEDSFEKNRENKIIKKLKSKWPELQKPSLWFEPFKFSNFIYYPRHIKSAVRTFVMSIRKNTELPFLPKELFYLIFELVGKESFLIGEPSLHNNYFRSNCLVNWVFSKSRISSHGLILNSCWHML